MKKGLLLVICLVLAASLLLIGCESEEKCGSASSSQQTGIWVSGTGEVTAAPDLAILTLGVAAQETTVSAAQSEAASAMSAVLGALRSNGVADKDIQTQWYSISPVTRWDDKNNEQITTGYSVTNMVTVKIRDVNKSGTIIDAVAAAGGNFTRMNGITFTVDDPTAYNTQAREKAVQDAAAKAQQLATLAGVELGKAIYISESGGYYVPQPIRLYDSVEGYSPSTPISAGELDITVTVQVAYAIE